MLKLVYKSKLLSILTCSITRLIYRQAKKEIDKRSKLSLLDYNNLAKPLPKYFHEICTDNNCFGIGFCIRRFANIKDSYINGWIEHGYFWSDDISELAKISFTNNILTFGNHRFEINHKMLPKKNVIKIGPYIHYANDYLNDDEFRMLKRKLGKILLVYPVHSGTGMKAVYDLQELIDKVKLIAHNYNTIIFSLFWSDLTPEYETVLKENKYLIFCSGHRSILR